jgi:hypothetical protein
VELKVFGVIATETTRAGGAVALTVGTTLDPDGCGISLTDARMAVGSVISATNAEADIGAAPTAFYWANATTIKLALDQACDAGAITFIAIWKPLTSGATVVAAT